MSETLNDVESATVLVTEDNPLHMKIFKLNIQLWGLTVLEAENGERGLEIARREHPDLILADLSMPKLDGWEMIRQLKSDVLTKDIPVIVVSARRQQDEISQPVMQQIDAYVTKPFDPEALVELVREKIRERAG